MYLMLTCPNVTKEALPLTFQKVRLIKAKAQWGGSQKVPLSCYQRKVLFEQCPEYTIKDYHSRRCDLVLCLFDGCPLMGFENEDVEYGIQRNHLHFQNGLFETWSDTTTH